MAKSSLFFETLDMAEKGRILTEVDFDKQLYKHIKNFQKKYPVIKYDPKKLVPSNDEMADTLFEFGKSAIVPAKLVGFANLHYFTNGCSMPFLQTLIL